MEVSEGFLCNNGKRVETLSTKETSLAIQCIDDHMKKKVFNKLGFKQVLLDSKKADLPPNAKKTKLPHPLSHKFFIWGNPKSDNEIEEDKENQYTFDQHDTLDHRRALVIFSSTTSPGLWSNDAFLSTEEKHATVLPYLQKSMNGPIDYHTVFVFSVGAPDHEKDVVYSQRVFNDSVRALYGYSKSKRLLRYDFVTDDMGGTMMYNFIRRNPSFSLGRIGIVAMLGSAVNVNRDFFRLLPGESDDWGDCQDYDAREAVKLIQTRFFNFVETSKFTPAGSEFPPTRNTTGDCVYITAGCTEAKMIPTSACDEVFNYIEDQLQQAKIDRLKMMLLSFLLVFSVALTVFGYILSQKTRY